MMQRRRGRMGKLTGGERAWDDLQSSDDDFGI